MPTVEESIATNNAVTVDDVKRFHAQFYGASNAELAIVGDFDADATRALVTELFGDWKSKATYTRVPDPFRPNQPAALRLVVPDKANAFLLGRERIALNDLDPDYPMSPCKQSGIGTEFGVEGLKEFTQPRLINQ